MTKPQGPSSRAHLFSCYQHGRLWCSCKALDRILSRQRGCPIPTASTDRGHRLGEAVRVVHDEGNEIDTRAKNWGCVQPEWMVHGRAGCSAKGQPGQGWARLSTNKASRWHPPKSEDEAARTVPIVGRPPEDMAAPAHRLQWLLLSLALSSSRLPRLPGRRRRRLYGCTAAGQMQNPATANDPLRQTPAQRCITGPSLAH